MSLLLGQAAEVFSLKRGTFRFCSCQDRLAPQIHRASKAATHGSLRLGNLNCLADHLALLVRGEKSDIRRIATAPDADDAFNRR